MWFITSILVRGEKVPTHRTFGYFKEYPNAKKAIEENLGDMHECLYDYLVLEWIGEGIHHHSEKEEWFRWDERWLPSKKPSKCVGIVNWALG